MAYRLDQTKEDAIYDWAVASLPGVTVIWDKGNGPRPPLPYITLNILGGPIPVGDRPDLDYKQTDTYIYTFRKRITLSINVIGYEDHFNKAQTLADCLYIQTKIDILNLAGMACWGYSGPLDVSKFVDTEWEFRSQLDVFLSYGTNIEDSPGEVHKIGINGQTIEIP